MIFSGLNGNKRSVFIEFILMSSNFFLPVEKINKKFEIVQGYTKLY